MQAVVLLSGGLDCGLNLALAAKNKSARLALTVDYGQRAAKMEIAAAQALAKYYNVEWKLLDLKWLGAIHANGLTRSESALPHLAAAELDSPQATDKSMRAVWVANRNGVLLNVAAAHAEALGADTVVAGFNREEAASFPDNSEAFLASATHAFSYSTLNKIKAEAFTKSMDKTEIVAAGMAIDFPFELLWSCYTSGPERCWECESCMRTERAFMAHGKQGQAYLEKLGYQK